MSANPENTLHKGALISAQFAVGKAAAEAITESGRIDFDLVTTAAVAAYLRNLPKVQEDG